MANDYLAKGNNELAYAYAKKGRALSDDCQFDKIISIAAFYCPNGKEDGFAALNRLLLRKSTPEGLRKLSMQNLRFYLTPLENLTLRPILFDLPHFRDPKEISRTIWPAATNWSVNDRSSPRGHYRARHDRSHPNDLARPNCLDYFFQVPTGNSSQSYFATNPSIVTTQTGYTVLCRTVNYTHERGRNYHSADPLDPIIRTRNFMLTYSKELQLLSQKEIIENLARTRWSSKVVGLEDCRLFMNPSGLGFTCSTYDTNPRCIPQISLCTLNEEQEVKSLIPLQGPVSGQCEKNWLPFYKDGSLHVVYSFDPFTVYKVNEADGTCRKDFCYEPQYSFTSFRGSAGPIVFDGGYLIIVHEVSFTEQAERIYSHRFVFLDKEFVVTKVSRPFSFQHTGVEYCCGMTMDHDGKNILITCGIEDHSAFIGSVPVETVRSLLFELGL